MSEWVLNQSWGLPVLLAFLVIVFVFESRKAFKAYKEKDASSWAGHFYLRLWLYWQSLSWWLIKIHSKTSARQLLTGACSML